jgi:hypothetical protein
MGKMQDSRQIIETDISGAVAGIEPVETTIHCVGTSYDCSFNGIDVTAGCE